MESKTVKVPAIGCNGCVNAIKGEVSEIEGVQSVDGDADTKMVTIQWDSPASWENIRQTMTEIEYAPQDA